MKRTKLQQPSSRETASTKVQPVPLVEGWHSIRYESKSNTEGLTPNDGPVKKPGLHPFDLEERTARSGESVIRLVKKIPRGVNFPENNRLVDQLVGCSTSIGANYCEANEGVSKKDFRHPISRCVKEAKETRFFLRMVAASEPKLAAEARGLYREANELLLIFAAMYRK